METSRPSLREGAQRSIQSTPGRATPLASLPAEAPVTTPPPRRLDVTLHREACPAHPDVTVKKVKLRKTKLIPCYRCLQAERDGAVAGEVAAQQRLRAVEAALEAERACVSSLTGKVEELEKERAVLGTQMAKLMDQIGSLSDDLSEALKHNTSYEHKLKAASAGGGGVMSLLPRTRPSTPIPLEGRDEGGGLMAPIILQQEGGSCGNSPIKDSSKGGGGGGRDLPQRSDSPTTTTSAAHLPTSTTKQSSTKVPASPAKPPLPPLRTTTGPTSNHDYEQRRPAPPPPPPPPAAAAVVGTGSVGEELAGTAMVPNSAHHNQPAAGAPPAAAAATTTNLVESSLPSPPPPPPPPAAPLPPSGSAGAGLAEEKPRSSGPFMATTTATPVAAAAVVVVGGREGGKDKEEKGVAGGGGGGGGAGKGMKEKKKKEEEAAGLGKRSWSSKRWLVNFGLGKRTKGTRKLPPSQGSGNDEREEEDEEEEEEEVSPYVDDLNKPRSIPQLTKRLLYLLETSPHDLKRIYLTSEPLTEWRLELLCDMQLRVATPPPRNGAQQHNQSSEEAEAAASNSRLFVSDELDGVKRLSEMVKKTVFMHVDNCFNLAQSDPEVLVQALEVVRLHEVFEAKKKPHIARRKVNIESEGSQHLASLLRLFAIEDWDAQVVSTVKASASDRAIEVFTAAHLEAADGGDDDKVGGGGLSRLQAMLYASRRLLADLSAVLALVEPLFPSRYKVRDLVRRAYDDHLTRQAITMSQGDMGDFEVGDLLEFRSYLDELINELSRLGQQEGRGDLLEVKERCYGEYLAKTHQQMTEWFDRILKRDAPVLLDETSQRPVTSTPEDLFHIILCHLDIASSSTTTTSTGNDLVSFILVVLNGLKAFVAEHLNIIRTIKQRRHLSDKVDVITVSAYINDYDRLQDKVSELRDQLFFGGKLDEAHLATIDPVLDQLNEEVMRICLESKSLLAYLVLRDATATLLKGSPFDKHSTTRVVDEALLTFQDWFTDLKVWLSQFFFSHTVRACFESLVSLYVLSVLRGVTPFQDYMQTAQDMRNHKQAIKTAMAPYETELTQAGISQQHLLFVVLDDLIEVVDKGPKLYTAWTGYLLRDLPPPWNVDAVLHLGHLRGDNKGVVSSSPFLPDHKAKARAKMLEWYNTDLADTTTTTTTTTRSRGANGQPQQQKSLLWNLRSSPLLSGGGAAGDMMTDGFIWDIITNTIG